MPSSEQGVNLNRYMVVPRTLIFITRDDKVLLLKGADNKRLWAELYNGVGGHIEIGEDPLSAAHRELFEETGLANISLSLCGIVQVNTNTNPGVCIFVFAGEARDEELSHSTEGNLEWIGKSSLTSIPLVADLPILLPKVLAYKPGLVPFIAHSWYDENGNLELAFC